MKRVVFAVLSIFLVSQIPAVQAASTKTLGDLVRIVRNSGGQPVTFSAEANGGLYGTTYASVWVNGSTNGQYRHLEDAEAQTNLTFDYASNEEYARVRTEMRLKDGILYGRIKEVIIRDSMVAETYESLFSDVIGKWHHINLLEEGKEYWEEYYDEYQRVRDERDEEFVKVFEPFLQIIERSIDGGNTYSISLPISERRSLLQAMIGETESLSSSYARERARELLRSVRLAFRANVDLNIKDELSSLESGMGVSTSEWYINARSSYDLVSSVPVVRIPTDSIDIMESYESLDPDNPRNRDSSGNISDARDAQRRSDINTILNAIYQYAIDNDGNLPQELTANDQEYRICKANKTCNGVSLVELPGTYLVTIPADPQQSTTSSYTGYMVKVTTNNRIIVTAPGAENASVSVTR